MLRQSKREGHIKQVQLAYAFRPLFQNPSMTEGALYTVVSQHCNLSKQTVQLLPAMLKYGPLASNEMLMISHRRPTMSLCNGPAMSQRVKGEALEQRRERQNIVLDRKNFQETGDLH